MSGPGRPIPDLPARRRAATDFETTLVVTAGAGTGKTSLLIERILTAVGSGRVDIDRMAAITFTDKAAGEMRGRLALGLERLRALALGEEVPGEEQEADRALGHLREEGSAAPETIASRALEALRGLDRARVETIHTFCSALLREHPVEAGVDPAFEVDQGEVYRSLLEECWEAFLARELGPAGKREELWGTILDGISLPAVREAALALAGFGVPEEFLEGARVKAGGDLVRGEVDRLVVRIDRILERQRGMTPKTAGYFRSVREALRAFHEEGVEAPRKLVERDADLLRRIRGGSPPSANTRLAGVTKKEMERASKESLRLVRKLFQAKEGLLSDLVDAVAPFARGARERLLARGFISFDGLLVLARNLLRDNPGIRERLKRKYRMLLIDEFQDTDPLQYEIVFFLAEKEGKGAADAFEAEPAPGRLFIVGDPKQSIYRFRGADYTAFRLATERIEKTGGAHLTLTASFRSLPGIVESVNALMSADDGCWTESDFQPEYERIEAVREGTADSPRVEIWTVEGSGGLSAAERREAEGRIISEAVDDACGGIALLLRAFTNLVHYLRPLREREIPFVVDGGREFLERPEVGHLLSILKALARPSDPVALLSFLRSPAGGVKDTELAAYASKGHGWSWREEPDPSEFPALADAFKLMRKLHEKTRDARPDEVVRRALSISKLLILSAAAFEGPQRVANLKKLAVVAGELAREGRLSLIEVVEALEEGRTADVESDSPLADEETDAVRVTTIHKAKGLEFDTVIVPDLARQDLMPSGTEKAEVDLFRLGDGRLHLSLKVEKLVNLARIRMEAEQERHEEAEEIRVLYVALTRAKDRLVLMAAKPRSTVRWIEALSAWGYDVDAPPEDGAGLLGGKVVHRVLTAKRPARRAERELPRRARSAVDSFHRAHGSYMDALRPPLSAPSEEETWRDADEESGSPSGVRRFASSESSKAVGIVAHRLLEDWDGDRDDSLLGRVHPVATEVAQEARVGAAAIEEEVRKILESFLSSDLRKRLREIEILGREIPMLLAREDGRAYGGTIDLLYRDPDGHHVVADYKTDQETDASALKSRYGPQLQIYAESVRRALNLPASPRAELWLLRSGRCVVL